ncbi:MAG: signal peptidase II [Paracoccaceae bacterium]
MKNIKKYFDNDKKINQVMIIVIISSFIFILDQLTKYFVVHILNLSDRLSITVISGFINFRMAWNDGINFGLFANSSEIMRIILIVISILICIGIFFWAIKQNNILLLILSSAIIGGALGNVVDRIIYGAVADFLNITCCGIYNPYSFNIADISIFFGVVGIIFFPNSKNQNR